MNNAEKDGKKLDWMYSNPGASVDREEYLLGRKIDKSLDLLNAEESKSAAGPSHATQINQVEYECVPPSIRTFKAELNEQVDLAQKLQEDPLLAIRKREEECRKEFLQNPIQVKKLQKLLKEKKLTQNDADNDSVALKNLLTVRKVQKSVFSDEADQLLFTKYILLKNKLSEEDLSEVMTAEKKKKAKKSKRRSSSSESSSSSSSEDKRSKKRAKKRSSQKATKKRPRKRLKSDSSTAESDSSSDESRGRKSRKQSSKNNARRRSRSDSSRENRKETTKQNDYIKPKQTDNRYRRERRPGLSQAEMERKRQEMMQNAEWREKERKDNVKRYRDEDRRKEQDNKEYSSDFMRNELLKSAKNSTVESRIKSNIHNIQRSKGDMDRNFARRH